MWISVVRPPRVCSSTQSEQLKKKSTNQFSFWVLVAAFKGTVRPESAVWGNNTAQGPYCARNRPFSDQSFIWGPADCRFVIKLAIFVNTKSWNRTAKNTWIVLFLKGDASMKISQQFPLTGQELPAFYETTSILLQMAVNLPKYAFAISLRWVKTYLCSRNHCVNFENFERLSFSFKRINETISTKWPFTIQGQMRSILEKWEFTKTKIQTHEMPHLYP